jgi:zeaxanthin glucosyltransferase
MKIGFISMPVAGHLNPMTALARKLRSRGHEIVFIGVPDAGPYVRAAGLPFVPYCEEEFPEGSGARTLAPISKLHGPEVTRLTIQEAVGGHFQAASKHLPRKLWETGVEALVLDTIHMYLEVVPMSLGMPYAQVWAILNIDFSGATLPSVLPGPYDNTPGVRQRNLAALQESDNAFFGIVKELAAPYAERAGLKIDWSDPTPTFSKLAIVSQTPKEFDLPGIPWPPQFHHTGPFFDEAGREPIPFPWEKLDSRPLIYVSLGTLLNGIEDVYKNILAAVEKLPENQVVLAKGYNIELSRLGSIPSNVIVVEKAPQIDLLKRAALCINHAGLNTTLESLAHGVPMVAIPLGYDQFGVAIRIVYHGVGESLGINDLTADGLQMLIQRVLTIASYRKRAQDFKNIIARRRGLDVAAEVIEQAFQRALANRSSELPTPTL